jgi:hypothetical protein
VDERQRQAVLIVYSYRALGVISICITNLNTNPAGKPTDMNGIVITGVHLFDKNNSLVYIPNTHSTT